MIGSTKQFRKAQRYYGENLCGFSHPEYDYKKLVTFYVNLDEQYYPNALQVLYQTFGSVAITHAKTGFR